MGYLQLNRPCKTGRQKSEMPSSLCLKKVGAQRKHHSKNENKTKIFSDKTREFTSFLVTEDNGVCVWVYTSSIHLSIDRHVGCFLSFSIVNNDAVNIGVRIFLQNSDLII